MSDYILTSKYLNGNEKTFEDVINRVANAISPDDEIIKQKMLEKKFCPAGRTLTNAGTNKNLIPNCVALPTNDGIKNIVHCLTRATLLQRLGTGNGFNFSELCLGKCFRLKSARISQKNICMSIYHPDIYSFITLKTLSIVKIVCVDKNFFENIDEKIKLNKIFYNNKFILEKPNEEIYMTKHELLEFIAMNGCTTINISQMSLPLTNYFVVKDTLVDICKVMELTSELCNKGNNFTINISKLRPAWSKCFGATTKSSGPIAFIHCFDLLYHIIDNIDKVDIITWLYMYSSMFHIIQQQGRSGAQILVLNIYHPNIYNFITVKQDLNVINNFNISVLFTNTFMNKLLNKPDEIIRRLVFNSYDENFLIIDSSEITMTHKELYDEFVHSAWLTGEPGVLFEDNMNNHNILKKHLGLLRHVNPCGEISMYPNECCNLGSINIVKFIKEGKTPKNLFDIMQRFDSNDFVQTIIHSTRFLNNVIDHFNIPDEELLNSVLKYRRIGLGIMGWSYALMKLKIPYDSQLARDFATKLSKMMFSVAKDTSMTLISKSKSLSERLGINNLPKQANIGLCCAAPTGSIGLLCETSYSIEPEFRLCYKKIFQNSDKVEFIINPYFEKYLLKYDLMNDKNLIEISTKGLGKAKLYKNNGELYIPKQKHIEVFKCANDISPDNHMLMQAAFQKYFDNSISKTVNFPEHASKLDIYNMFIEAWKHGIKGITVFRDNSRTGVLQSIDDKDIHCKSGTCDI